MRLLLFAAVSIGLASPQPGLPKDHPPVRTPGRREARIQCYLHTTDYAAQGWYAPAERTIPLRLPFQP